MVEKFVVFLNQWLLLSDVSRIKFFTGPACLKMQKIILALINSCSDALNFDGSVLQEHLILCQIGLNSEPN